MTEVMEVMEEAAAATGGGGGGGASTRRSAPAPRPRRAGARCAATPSRRSRGSRARFCRAQRRTRRDRIGGALGKGVGAARVRCGRRRPVGAPLRADGERAARRELIRHAGQLQEGRRALPQPGARVRPRVDAGRTPTELPRPRALAARSTATPMTRPGPGPLPRCTYSPSSTRTTRSTSSWRCCTRWMRRSGRRTPPQQQPRRRGGEGSEPEARGEGGQSSLLGT